MDIYWIENKERRGPQPEVVIISLLEQGDITPETKAWHKGCATWIPVEELPALSSYFRKREDDESSLDEGGESQPGQEGSAVPQGEVKVAVFVTPHPVIRLIARFVDSLLYYILVLFLIRCFSSAPVVFLSNPQYMLLSWVPWIFLEAFCLKLWGTTLGKALCGVHVRSLKQREVWTPGTVPSFDTPGVKPGQLSYPQALKRCFQVMCFGMGFMLPLLMLMGGLVSLFLLKKTGATMWDNSSRTVETCKPMAGFQWFLIFAVVVTGFLLIGVIAEPWVAEMMNQPGMEAFRGILNRTR